MPSEEKKHIESLFRPFLKQEGFKKRGSTWWRNENDYIQVVNLQGSMWSRKFYINLGVYIKALGTKERPSEADCHIRQRLEGLCSSEPKVLDWLNYEDFSPEELPRKNLITMLETYGLPWLAKVSTFEGGKVEYLMPNRVMTKWQRDMLDEYFAQQNAPADAKKRRG